MAQPGLSPEEEDELRRLKQEEADYQQEQEGDKAVDTVDQARVKPRQPESRPFSFFRATVGAVRDAAQNLEDTIFDVAPYAPGITLNPGAMAESLKPVHKAVTLPTLKGEENAGTAERIVRGLGSFAIEFAGASKFLQVGKAASWLGRAGRAMVAGGAVDFTMKPEQTNLANTLRDGFGIHSDTLDALASEEDDNRLWARFKAAAVNAPVGLAADALFQVGFKGVQAYRAFRGSYEEARAGVEAARADLNIKPSARNINVDAEAAAPKAAGAFDETVHVRPEKPPQTFDDVLDFLKRKTSDLGQMDDATLSRFAKNLIEGEPENALAKLGIDPVKLDFSAYDNPEVLARLQKGLSEVYEGIAQRLGRSGIRVTEEQTAKAARAWASQADVLKDLYGKSSNLAEVLTAGRMFVGAHAHKLMDSVEQAIKSGAGDAEWQTFMDAFKRHAYYLGAVRGAGSEVGRALRSLKMGVRVGAKNAAKEVTAAVQKEGARQAGGALSEGTSFLADILDPSERLLFLGQLKKLEDAGDISRFVRGKSGGFLRRVDLALHETVGNLFTAGTAVANVGASFAMMGLKALTKSLVAVERAALSPLTRDGAQKARVAAMEAWAYTDGILGGFRRAFNNTLALLEREGFAEVSLNFEGLGLRGLAKDAAARSLKGQTREVGHFERADVVNERWFAMRPSERAALDRTIESWDTPKLLEHSLKFLVRTAGAALNGAGSLSRAGTITLINAPDQFAGTLAARAGAQAQAIRLAGQEAAELGLSGKELSTYLRQRMVQLTENVDGWHESDAFSKGAQEAALAHGDAEAREVLFQDKPETVFSKAVSWAQREIPFAHLVVPFVRTPLRILERSVIDFTPVGLAKSRIRDAIVAGGPERDEALTRIGLGTLAMMTAYQLAEDRTIVGQDGGYKSLARYSRPSYSLKIGDDAYEFSRIDPLGTLLGWAADLRAYLDSQGDNPEAGPKAMQVMEGSIWAASANILSKTWLQSLKNLTDLAGATDDDDFYSRLRNYANSFATRIVPGSGLQRSTAKGLNPFVKEAASFNDALLRDSLGSDTLPVKRDALGRPVPFTSLDRVVGIKGGPTASPVDDPLQAELEKYSVELGMPGRTLKGVHLTGAQYSRWLELRGQVIKNAAGLSLEDTLKELIKLPEYQQANRAARIQMMRDELNAGQFTEAATAQLIREDDSFAKKVLQQEVWQQMNLTWASRQEKDQTTSDLSKELGLTPQQ